MALAITIINTGENNVVTDINGLWEMWVLSGTVANGQSGTFTPKHKLALNGTQPVIVGLPAQITPALSNGVITLTATADVGVVDDHIILVGCKK